MFKFWEYPITFQDPASIYAYHLFSVHHDIIWFLIIILILVYWCLYKVICDFNWYSFNNSGLLSFLTFFFNFFKLRFCWAITQIELFLLNIYSDCVNVKELYNLGVINELGDVTIYFITSYINLINFIFGIQSFDVLYSAIFLDRDGKIFFNDEIQFFDSQIKNNSVADIVTQWDVSYERLEMLMNDRFVSLVTFHYITPAYFFNGRVDVSAFLSRKWNHLREQQPLVFLTF